ncbi:hypothetical protein LUX29_21235 [Aureimonas altamirensis]|uniref:hypothetical protein n=1 Tax=Aureimonas altamirensis TaxID=370622 RepID=UPI001E3B9EC3|nr:hypothetical protein [Aureimonas altamirensis]UHD45480.1 hypothetical protein LUX29_21235 [Aureimonas altamirensis]
MKRTASPIHVGSVVHFSGQVSGEGSHLLNGGHGLCVPAISRHRHYERQIIVLNVNLGRRASRWRKFRELAQDCHELATARDFLSALRSMDTDPSAETDGRSVEEWIAWAEEWLQRADPTANGIDGVFRQVAAVTDWTYRD